MLKTQELLDCIHQGVDDILELETRSPEGKVGIGGLREDFPLRFTQWEALLAYKDFLDREDLASEDKISGYFEIPTGVGKTAMFIGIAHAARKHAKEDKKEFRTVIVEPTINLLEQTKKEFLFYAPDMANEVGLYWGEEKDLSKPVTIMTYDSWVDLVEKGELSSENVDLLISDEGHRGTSDRREDNIFRAFNGSTVRLGFTATATFDQEKSVDNTHKNRIYSKTISEAVHDGELADYIQTYFYIIRAEPINEEVRHEFDMVANDTGRGINYEARKAAWNNWAVHAFENETDNQTGDLVSDNQAGLFVADISHAEQVTRLLNSSPELQRCVVEQGRSGVAVTVHSSMSYAEQTERLRAYQAGEYMAIVADEKIKEGFDYPPMKTVFDFPHGSLVDKTQILGRGARQWWNEQKDRYEGLTFLDTVVYVGSEDPEEDAKLRQEALKKAVLSMDILNDTIVLSPARRANPSKGSSAKPGLALKNVEQFTTIKEVELFKREREVARTGGRIDIKDDMRVELQLEMERTNVGPKRLISQAKSPVPKSLSAGHIRWWAQGGVVTTTPEHWDWVMAEYAQWPTVNPRIKITEDMRQHLQSEIDRTNTGYKKILRGAENIPAGVGTNTVENWRSGSVKTANPEHWAWIMARYATLPTMSEKIEITDEMRQHINAEFERTGVGPHGLIENNSDVPYGLTPTIMYGWMKRSRTVHQDHWDWTIRKYEELSNLRVLTDEDRAKLNVEMERTRLKGRNFLSLFDDAPSGLKPSMINNWVNGHTKTAQEQHWVWVCEKFAGLPDNVKIQHPKRTRTSRKPKRGAATFIDITKEMKAALVAEIKRTGAAERKLINNSVGIPDGLTGGILRAWLNGNSKTAESQHWEWVMNRYAELPGLNRTQILTEEMHGQLEAEIVRTKVGIGSILAEEKAVPKGLTGSMVYGWRQNRRTPLNPEYFNWVISKYSALPSKVQLTRIDKKHLRDEIKRTGVGQNRLVSMNDDVPEGLTPNVIAGWVLPGKKFPLAEHFGWVKDKYAGIPDAPRRIRYTNAMRKHLLAEIKRTGIGGDKLLSLHEDVPDDLRGHHISGLQSSQEIKTVRSDYWDWIISKYGTLPTAPRIRITDAMYTQLDDEMERTDIGSRRIIAASADVPDGLTDEMIMSWQNRSVKTARRDYWDWTLARYREQPDMLSLDDDDRQVLAAEIERTGVSYNQIIQMNDDIPDGLTGTIIETWKDAHVKKASADRWEWTLAKYRALPDAPKRIDFTAEMKKKILFEKRRTGVGSTKLVSSSNNPPVTLRPNFIDSMARGGAKTVREEEWKWIVAAYEALPTVSKKVTLTDNKISKLKAEFRRTGIGFQALFSKASSPPPKGLTVPIVQGWWHGETRQAHPEHLRWMTESYASLPNKERGPT